MSQLPNLRSLFWQATTFGPTDLTWLYPVLTWLCSEDHELHRAQLFRLRASLSITGPQLDLIYWLFIYMSIAPPDSFRGLEPIEVLTEAYHSNFIQPLRKVPSKRLILCSPTTDLLPQTSSFIPTVLTCLYPAETDPRPRFLAAFFTSESPSALINTKPTDISCVPIPTANA